MNACVCTAAVFEGASVSLFDYQLALHPEHLDRGRLGPAATWAMRHQMKQAGWFTRDWHAQVLWRVAGTLVELVEEWRGLLAGSTAGRAPADTTMSAGMDIARVEGFAFSILCHRDAVVSPSV